jgi:hypothetical protein
MGERCFLETPAHRVLKVARVKSAARTGATVQMAVKGKRKALVLENWGKIPEEGRSEQTESLS